VGARIYDRGPDNRRRDRDLGPGTGLVVPGGGALAAAIIGAVTTPDDGTLAIDARGVALRF